VVQHLVQQEVLVQVQEQVQELEEQELPLVQEQGQQEQALGQELQQEALAQVMAEEVGQDLYQYQEEEQEVQAQARTQVLEQGQEVLLRLAQVREQVLVLEAQMRILAGVMEQAEAQVLDLALGVGLQQVVLERGQVVLARKEA
jgi:hypothetical protein